MNKDNKKKKNKAQSNSKRDIMAQYIRDVQNETVNNANFIYEHGTTLPKNLPPVYVVNEELANYYTAIHKENVSKTFSLSKAAKMELIYNNGEFVDTPLFKSSDVNKLINNSIDSITNRRMGEYESVARGLRANEALNTNNIESIITDAISNGRHKEGLEVSSDKVTKAIPKNLDFDSMNEFLDNSFVDFVREMKNQSSDESAGIRSQIQTLRESAAKDKEQLDLLTSNFETVPNKGAANKIINNIKSRRESNIARASELEKKLGIGFDSDTVKRIPGHLSNLSSESPTVSPELIADYQSYISKRDGEMMEYFNKATNVYDKAEGVEELAITEMINDRDIMNPEARKNNKVSNQTYLKLRQGVRSDISNTNGPIADEVLEEVESKVSSLQLQKLTPAQREMALDGIENNALRGLVDASYIEYAEDGAINYKPTNYISSIGTTYKSSDGKYAVRVKGLDDIEKMTDPEGIKRAKSSLDIDGLNESNVTKYLDDYDAYADIDARYKESVKLDEDLYADTLLTKVKEFKKFQENKDVAAIRSQYDAIAFHGDQSHVPDFVQQPTRESFTLNPRVKAMIPEELSSTMPRTTAIKSDILNTIERDKNVFDLMDTVIKPLSTQTVDATLRIDAEDTIRAFDYYKQIRTANGYNESGTRDITAMNDMITASYNGKYTHAGVDGDIGRMYESSLTTLGFEEGIPFAKLDQPSQLAAMDEIESSMVERISGRIGTIKSGLDGITHNKDIIKERERVADQSSVVSSDMIEIENLYNGGLNKDTAEDLEINKNLLWENDYNTRTAIEAEREAMKDQRISLADNISNDSSLVDKKDYEGILAYTQNATEVRRVRDVGGISGRTNYLTYEDLMEGLVKDGDQYVPVEQFRQYHTMMDATHLMRTKPTGEFKDISKYTFSPEEWKRGSVVIGKSEIPITQFREYYDRDVRIERQAWLRDNDPNLVGDVRIEPAYRDHSVPQDMSGQRVTVDRSKIAKQRPKSYKELLEEYRKRVEYKERSWPAPKEPLPPNSVRDASQWHSVIFNDWPENKKPLHANWDSAEYQGFSTLFQDWAEIEKPVILDPDKIMMEQAPKLGPTTELPIRKIMQPEDELFQGKILSASEEEAYLYSRASLEPIKPPPSRMSAKTRQPEKKRGVYHDSDSYIRSKSNDVGFSVEYTPDDYHNIHRLSVMEDVLSGKNAMVVVEKPLDRNLLKNLNRWKENNTPVILKGSDVSKEIIGVDGNTVGLRNRSALASETKFSINYKGEDTLFEALMRFDKMVGSSAGETDRAGNELIKSMRDSKLKSEVSYDEARNAIKRNNMNNIIGTFQENGKDIAITRQHLLDRIKENRVFIGDGESVSKLVHDTAMINFSWMGIAGDNMNELMGAGIASLDRAVNSTSDLAILNAFSKNDVRLQDWHTIDSKKAHDVIMDAFGHRTKLEMLFEYLGEDGTSTNDAADTAIRVAKKVNEMNGVSNTTDNVYSSLLGLKKGLKKIDDKETQQYFSVIDDLVANDHSVLQKMLENPIEVPTDFFERTTTSDSTTPELELDDFQRQVQKAFNLETQAPIEEITENVSYNIASDALDKKIETMAKDSDYYTNKIAKYNLHKDNLQLRVAEAPSFTFRSNDKLTKEQARQIMTETLDQFESEDIGNDLKAILNQKKTVRVKGQDVELATKDIIKMRVLASFDKRDRKTYKKKDITVKRLNKRFEAALDGYVEQGIYKNAKSKVNKIQALRELNQEVPGSAVNYVRSKGGIVSAFGELGIIPKGDANAAGQMKVIEEAIQNMSFSSAEDVANFSLIQELIPGLTLSAQTKDINGNIINGTIGEHTNFEGLVDPIITSTSGEKIRLTDSRDGHVQYIKLNGLDSKDFRMANENAATKHVSKAIEDGSTKYNIAAGFSGNYAVMSRRPYGTGGVDPMTIIQNMSEFTSDNSKTGLVFDFETTGLPGKLSEEVFAPIEFSYLPYDKKYRTGKNLNFDDNASRVVTKYAKPNKEVKKYFEKALEDDTYSDLFRTKRANVGKDNSAFMILKNYAKYDNTEVAFNGKNYTWGSILTSDMSIDPNDLGKVIAHIGDEEIHTNMTTGDIVKKLKGSSKEVFDYLSSGGAKGPDMKFGIDAKDIKTERELVKTAVKKMNSYDKLIGHNITTADLKWLKRWANRLGIDDLPADVETKAIDTQDLLQAAQPGRKSNKLSDHTNDVMSSHLAYADIKTNVGLFNKLANDSTLQNLSKEVDNGLSNGDYIVKIASQKLGMAQIPKGRYQLDSIENAVDGIGGVLTLRNMDSNSLEEYATDNIAVIKKELADNWVNFGQDGLGAYEHSAAQSLDDASRTLYNAYGKPAIVDRYIQYGKSDFNVSRDILEEMHNSLVNATSELNGLEGGLDASINLFGLSHATRELGDGVFESRTLSDMERLIISNSSKLTGKNYIEQLTYLADNAATRKKEFEHVAQYFDTDEGKLARDYLKQIHYREQAGIITKAERREYGDKLYQRVMLAKRNGIAANKLEGFEQVINGKFVAGEITKAQAERYRGVLGDKYVETFQPQEMILDLRNAEQTRRSIFAMSEDLAARIHYRSNKNISLEEAQAKVVNEVILPILSDYSVNEELKKSIKAYGTPNANPDYMHAVNSLSSELASRKQELASAGGMLHDKGYKTVIATKGVNKSMNPDVFAEIEEAMRGTLDELDFVASSTQRTVDGALVDVPTPGGEEKIREIVDVIQANEEASMRSIAETEFYKRSVGNGYDPIANGINPVPMLDFSHNNSGGMAKLNAMDKVSEWRITDNPKTRWMTYRSADELLNIAGNLKTHTDAYEIENIVRAIQNQQIDPDTANYYRRNFKDAIQFIETKTKRPITDIAGIRALNQATVKKIADQYADMQKDSINGNAFDKSSIMRELMTRANQEVDMPTLENGLITKQMVSDNPTKYNAMKALGLMQPTSDGEAFYTGAIGTIEDFNNVYSAKGKPMTLDPRKVLLLGNERMNIDGEVAYANQLAGMPITNLTDSQLAHVAGDKHINKAHKAQLENYLEKIKGVDSYNESALKRYREHVAKAKTLSPSQDIIEEINKRIVNEHGNNAQKNVKAARQTVEEAMNGHPNIKGIDPSNVVDDIKRITDHPMYGDLTERLSDARAQTKKMLEGVRGSNLVKFGAIGLGVGVGLKLVGNYTNSGRRPEENPNGGAPRVDGTYDNGYNGGRRPSIGEQTVRLEEGGRGLNISAKAKNRNGTSDNDLNEMLSGMLGKSFGSNVNIKYQDDRSVIDNSYVQNLVSDALFG